MQKEDRLTDALEGRLDPCELTDEEHAAWVKAFNNLMGEPGPEEEAFFARRRKLGLGVGLDDEGRLIHARPKK
ncbi:hypothetical protein [Cribrihabitans pelagius]|uniref:hypothetical protein n=1 Tax=Cribrihabitans pelagius TaxID=1765746 RepID=UPI003B593382